MVSDISAVIKLLIFLNNLCVPVFLRKLLSQTFETQRPCKKAFHLQINFSSTCTENGTLYFNKKIYFYSKHFFFLYIDCSILSVTARVDKEVSDLCQV